MARSPNCTGAPVFKGRVDVSISYPDPDIQTLDTPEALPTSEPATAQVSMTVASSHLATWSPFVLEHIDCAILYAAGQNTSDSAITVYYRVEKNGASIATGSGSVPASNFYTWSHFRFPDVQVGDVLTCKLWASASGCNWRKKALVTWPSNIGPKNLIAAEVKFGDIYSRPVGNADANYGPQIMMEQSSGLRVSLPANSNILLPIVRCGATEGLVFAAIGGYSIGSACLTHASYEMRCYSNYSIGRISYTPLTLRV